MYCGELTSGACRFVSNLIMDLSIAVEFANLYSELEKKRIKEGEAENLWIQEMQRHPFYINKTADNLVIAEALQGINADAEKRMPAMEKAKHYKEIGNFYLKHKAYKLAMSYFTKALAIVGIDLEMRAILHNNRSAALYFLENYQVALAEANLAIEFKPNYMKAHRRAALITKDLELYDDCLEHCNLILQQEPENAEIRDIQKEMKNKKNKAHRAEGKERERILSELKKRHIKFDDLKKGDPVTEEQLQPVFGMLKDDPIQLSADKKTFLWPIIIYFPTEIKAAIFPKVIEEVSMECIVSTFNSIHEIVPFAPRITLYYDNPKTRTLHKVALNKKLKNVIDEKSFIVIGGVLIFYGLPTDSEQEKSFLNRKLNPLPGNFIAYNGRPHIQVDLPKDVKFLEMVRKMEAMGPF